MDRPPRACWFAAIPGAQKVKDVEDCLKNTAGPSLKATIESESSRSADHRCALGLLSAPANVDIALMILMLLAAAAGGSAADCAAVELPPPLLLNGSIDHWCHPRFRRQLITHRHLDPAKDAAYAAALRMALGTGGAHEKKPPPKRLLEFGHGGPLSHHRCCQTADHPLPSPIENAYQRGSQITVLGNDQVILRR